MSVAGELQLLSMQYEVDDNWTVVVTFLLILMTNHFCALMLGYSHVCALVLY